MTGLCLEEALVPHPEVAGQEGTVANYGSPEGHTSISRKALSRPMKGLLLELADSVQHAVDAIEGNPAEIVGRGADGAPSARIDRVAEQTVLRVARPKVVRK